MVARMTELLALRPGDRVLEVGTGSGYQAAVLATLGARVCHDRAPRRSWPTRPANGSSGSGSADRVEVRVGDGSLGAPDEAPFAGIVVTAAAPAIPGLAARAAGRDGGRLVIPVGPRDRQELIARDPRRRRMARDADGPCVFVPLVGAEGWG